MQPRSDECRVIMHSFPPLKKANDGPLKLQRGGSQMGVGVVIRKCSRKCRCRRKVESWSDE